MNRSVSVVLIGVLATLFLARSSMIDGRPSFDPTLSMAQGGWKAEYESVCSKTDVAMTLSVGELKDVIARCVQLKARIEAQEESTRKVYLRRLQMCRDLYSYVLEAKERDR